MAFVKLDCEVLDSSLWAEDAETRITFITMLLMANHQGICKAAAPGIARRAGIPIDAVMKAIGVLDKPEGRIARADGEEGGYWIVNHMKYLGKDRTGAERMRRYRERLRAKNNITL